MLTRAEGAAVYEALKGILGEKRAKELYLELPGLLDVAAPTLADASEMIGEAHGPPVARPRSVEP